MSPALQVYGSICLDYEVGGINTHALQASAELGARVVWMPTFSSLNSRAVMRRITGRAMEGDGISLLDASGKLIPEVSRILTIVKDHEMVLATGHISPEEAFALVEAARALGIWRLVVTHAADREFVDRSLSLADQQRLVEMGAYIECCVSGLMPGAVRRDPADMLEAIKTIGAKNFVMSTDLGQARNPPPAEGMRMFMSLLLDNGLRPADIEIMAKVNPSRLLGPGQAAW